jgi:hypothetical protein
VLVYTGEPLAEPLEIMNHTEIKDQVEFAMPLGLLGEIAYRIFVAGSLRQIYDYREAALRRLFPA